MSRMTAMFERIQREHTFAPPLTEEQRLVLEAKLELPLPDDWREFFSLCNGASVHLDSGEAWYEFVPMEEVRRTRIDVFGQDADYNDNATQFWVSACYVRDGNYVSAALESVRGSFCWMLDSFHETYGDGAIIALSFSDFLEGALDVHKPLYWLENYPNFGTAPEHSAR